MLSIITPVFGKSDLTANFVRQISGWLRPDDELIIIDNNSPDNTLSTLNILKKTSPKLNLKIFSHSQNVGFGGANNIGANLAVNNKLLFISNDVEILGDVVTSVDNYLEEYPRRAVGPRLLNYNTG